MPISSYLRGLREKLGPELVLVPSVTVIVYDSQDRILLVKHSDAGVWVAPGGSMDPGETPADAAVREMWEETGLLVEPVRVLGIYGGPEFEVTYSNGDRVSYVMTVFECRVRHGTMRPDGAEILDLAYFSEADLDGLPVARWLRIVLPDAFRDRIGTSFKAPAWRPPG
jgi:8-oxo-dGTP pyrophosphatase MutT (NUDIX family)